MLALQVDREFLGDGYQGDVIGEATPDSLVNEFVSLVQTHEFTVFSAAYTCKCLDSSQFRFDYHESLL